jgi:hypothetical protein
MIGLLHQEGPFHTNLRLWVILVVDDPTVTMKCRTAIKVLLIYLNLCLMMILSSLSFTNCYKIFVPAWNLFRRNIFHRKHFCQNFFNEKLVHGTYFIGKFIPPMWNLFWYLFHDNSEICFGMNITKTIISFFVRQSLILKTVIHLWLR